MKITLFLIACLSINVFLYSQNTNAFQETKCNIVFKNAADKYGIIFNYSSQVFEDMSCVLHLPQSFGDFRRLVKETSGLDFKKFKDSLWVVSKNYSHQIKVVNAQNEPIYDAAINSKQLTSNFFGNIFLQLEELPQTLSIEHSNYFEEEVKITNATSEVTKVVLQTKSINLPEVKLSPLYNNSIYLNSNNQVQVKNKKMPLLAGQTQQDAFVSLLNLPQIFTNVESVAELNIKGGVNDQNLLLWNGIRMFQNSHFFGLLTAFNENLIDEMTVIDNATPVEYGNALTGTVKLDFDKSIVEKNQYGVGINNLSGQVFSRLALNENTELSLAFQRSFTDFYNSSTFQSYSEKAFRDTDLKLSENSDSFNEDIQREDDFYYRDAQFQLKKQIGKDFRINLQGIWFENQLTYQESINEQDTRISNYNNRNSALGLDALYKLSTTQSLVFNSNYSKHSSFGENNTFSGNLETDQSNTVENYFTQVYWENSKNHHSIKTGLDYQGSVVFNMFNNAVTEAFLNLGQVSNVYSGFGSYTYQNNRWQIYSGLRGIYFQRDKQLNLEPRMSVSYKLNKNFDVVLEGEVKSQNFKQIVDLDQNFLGIEKRRWVVSGDSISPPLQKTAQIEAMLKWNFNKIGGYASVYARDLSGLTADDQRFQNEGQFNGLQDGDSEIYGFLFHFYYKNEWFNSWLSYAHLKEKLIINNQSFNGNNHLDHQITWGSDIGIKNWHFSFAVNYHSGLAFTDVDEDMPVSEMANGLNVINFKSPNANVLPHYFRLDSSIQYQLKTNQYGNFKFSIGFINLTNEHNILRRNFRLNRVNTNNLQKIENIGLGFTANFGILWMF